MQKALLFLENDNVEMLERIAIFHYLFGYIHPFYNGNGRISRFISSYLLSKELDPLTSYRLSYTIKENIKSYYDSFMICNDIKNRADLTPFLINFLEIISEAIDKLHDALNKRFEQLRTFSNLSQRIPFIYRDSAMMDLAFYLIQAELFSEYGITAAELLELQEISRATLTKRMKDFENEGLLIKSYLGHNRSYRMNLDRLREMAVKYPASEE